MFNLKQSIKTHKIAFAIGLILFLIPFFWMKPGEIDMGGDGGRLYFYDPLHFIKLYALYNFLPFGLGVFNEEYHFLPFVTLIAFLKSVGGSSYVLSVLQNSIKLSLGFFSVYAIAKELIPKLTKEENEKLEFVSILTGLFYILSPLLTAHDRYVNPLQVHDQVFLNPLMFYLTLKFFITKKWRYLVGLLGFSVIFAHNFSYTAAPNFFSFYPLAFTFLILYVVMIRREILPKKRIFLGLLFFLLLHFFHLGPAVASLFDSGSTINTRVFNKADYLLQVNYFYGVLGYASLARHILLSPIIDGFWQMFTFLSPLIIILGFLKNRLRSKTFLFTGVFFLITLFFMSAKIGHIGVKFYESLFLYVPGFGMFRNFYIQWMYVFAFFYALLFGQALMLCCVAFKDKRVKLMLLIITMYIVGSAWIFIKGDQFNVSHVESNNTGRHIAMDPQYEKLLEYVRNASYGGNILQFPFTDYNFQVLHGTNNGAYLGATTIGQLTGVKDFAGYWHTVPYSQAFLQAAKEKDYETLKKILGLLNIRYIFYNSDPRIYDTIFTGRPFAYVRQFLPSTQKDYEEFIKPLVGEKLFEAGSYHLYLTKKESYIPEMYIPKTSIVYKYNPKYHRYYEEASSFVLDKKQEEKRVIYIEKNDCTDRPLMQTFCSQNTSFYNTPKIFFKKINPTKYKVTISDVENPFLLVFSDTFHHNWKLFISKHNMLEESNRKTYFNGDIKEGKPENIFFDKKTFETIGLQNIPETQHFSVNGFTNAWYINPEDIGTQREVTFIVEMIDQRLFYFALFISFLGFCGFIFWISILFVIHYRSKRRIVK